MLILTMMINRLEKVIRDAVSREDYARVKSVIDHLCHEYAYAVHQPHARNGGLIGLAAASIALGSVRPRVPNDCGLGIAVG
jgi:hypothetical protein